MHKWLSLSALIIILDQLTKWFAERTLPLFEPVAILPFLNFTLVYNTGAAFSLLSQAGGWQRWFFVSLALVVSVFIIVWLKQLKPEERLTATGLALLLGGAIGNLIDRLWHGKVIDFIDMHVAGYHWPAFNIADAAISMGAVLLIICSLIGIHRERQQGDDTDAPR
ncbi:signal peptidase II [Thiorhodospira sibirica]|uniref:signal peptidase II n=1 Tax=Thiorhodospira sibirica TaxID=154347 RepID=UPI00022C045C|nr:signal peptidase II [Thiorhodospira sibirica]